MSSRGFGGSTTLIPTHFPAWVMIPDIHGCHEKQMLRHLHLYYSGVTLHQLLPHLPFSLEFSIFFFDPGTLIFWEVCVKLRLLPWPWTTVWRPGEVLGSVWHGESSWWSDFCRLLVPRHVRWQTYISDECLLYSSKQCAIMCRQNDYPKVLQLFVL